MVVHFSILLKEYIRPAATYRFDLDVENGIKVRNSHNDEQNYNVSDYMPTLENKKEKLSA